VVGADAFVRDKLRQSLAERALGSALREMNFSKFQVGEDELSRAMDACRDYPCFSEKRVVVLFGAEKLKKKETPELLRYLQDPQPTTLLVIDAEKLDGRLEWVKALKKQGEVLEVPEVTREEAAAWARKCFEREAKKIPAGLAEELVEMVGNNLGVLQQSVAQLCLYAGDMETVELKDMEDLLVKVSEENIFEVVDSIFSENRRELHRSLRRLLESGEAPLKILALLYRHLSILLVLRFGASASRGGLLRMPPWARRRYDAQANKYARRLKYSLLKPIAEADIRLKGSALSGSLILKNCVNGILGLLAQG
jgi:DNA polymerase-3 subunit delta